MFDNSIILISFSVLITIAIFIAIPKLIFKYYKVLNAERLNAYFLDNIKQTFSNAEHIVYVDRNRRNTCMLLIYSICCLILFVHIFKFYFIPCKFVLKILFACIHFVLACTYLKSILLYADSYGRIYLSTNKKMYIKSFLHKRYSLESYDIDSFKMLRCRAYMSVYFNSSVVVVPNNSRNFVLYGFYDPYRAISAVTKIET